MSVVEELVDSGELAEGVSEEVVENFSDQLSEALPDDLVVKVAQELGNGLKSKAPEECIRKYLELKRDDVRPRTLERYRHRMRYPLYYLRVECGLESLNNITPEQASEFRDWVKTESRRSPIAPKEVRKKFQNQTLARKTVRDDTIQFRALLRKMARLNWAPEAAYKQVEVPELKGSEGRCEEKLDPDRADRILTYMENYEPATRQNVVILLLMKTGRRTSGLHALDLGDFDDSGEDAKLAFVDREETPLKEGAKHEATITLSAETAEIIRDYIDHKRLDETDEVGREPLLTTASGRISKSTIQNYAYKWTRPCAINSDGPEGHDVSTCEGAECGNDAHLCPVSRSPHAIRSGYVTAKIDEGASYRAVARRVGATKSTLMDHYDVPTDEEERLRYRDEIISDGSSASGYANGG